MSTLASFTKRFAVPLWKWYLGGLIALILTNLITLEIPQLAKIIVNAIGDNKVDHDLRYYALMLIGLGVLTIIFRALSRVLLFFPGRKVESASRSYLFQKMMHLPQIFFERFGMGDLISRLTNDIGQLRAFYAFGVLQLLNLFFLSVFIIGKMLSVHFTLTVLSITPLVLMIFFMKGVFSKLHQLSILSQESIGRLTNRVTEAFVNVHVIKANAAENTFAARAEIESQDVYDANIKSVYLRTIFFPLLNSLMNVSQVLVVLYGGYEVLHDRLTIGDILAFNVYLAYLSFPLSAFGIIVSLYQRSIAALKRITEIEVTPTESSGRRTDLAQGMGKQMTLEVRSLNYHFVSPSDEKGFALKNISFTLAPGRRIGLFGAIGSGKTTLFNLISRLQDPPPGSIFLDGVDILDLDPDFVRQKIGYVQQTVSLFSASIEQNLRFGAEQHTIEELKEAAENAQVFSEIEAFDAKWATEIGEKGLRLSGGQKQRIALARFLLRKPSILMLDDVLSAVDQKTERKMINALKAMQSSMLIASHRTLALRECDEVLILDNGEILDRGTFAVLQTKHPELFETEADHGK